MRVEFPIPHSQAVRAFADDPDDRKHEDVQVPNSAKRKLSANQIVADIRGGLDDALLKQKYGLTDKTLDSVYRKLTDAGLLTEAEILNRTASEPAQRPVDREYSLVGKWQCPSCHAPHDSEKKECPVCGIVVAKFAARQESEPSLGDGTVPIASARWSSPGLRMAAVVAIAILIAGGVFAVWVQFLEEPDPETGEFRAARSHRGTWKLPDTNLLAINGRTSLDELEIQLEPLGDLDFKTKAEVYALRSEAVTRYPQLLAGEYKPSNDVFGQIVDGLPWWGVLGAHRYGRGKRSIEGPSTHSLSILNPYLLVVASIGTIWDPDYFGVIDEQTGQERFICTPRSLRWYPKLGQAEVTYDAECLRRGEAHSFGLYAYNARDFNLRFIYVSYRDSTNIFKEREPARAYTNPQFIHQGGSCGYPGGCNNMSPATPPIDDIRISGWPARVVIHLWENYPRDPYERPDMTYLMNFN